jgi:hypothetical protein
MIPAQQKKICDKSIHNFANYAPYLIKIDIEMQSAGDSNGSNELARTFFLCFLRLLCNYLGKLYRHLRLYFDFGKRFFLLSTLRSVESGVHMAFIDDLAIEDDVFDLVMLCFFLVPVVVR